MIEMLRMAHAVGDRQNMCANKNFFNPIKSHFMEVRFSFPFYMALWYAWIILIKRFIIKKRWNWSSAIASRRLFVYESLLSELQIIITIVSEIFFCLILTHTAMPRYKILLSLSRILLTSCGCYSLKIIIMLM